MDRSNIEKIAKNPEDRLLLAKVWDKINAGMRKNISANSCFLNPREMEMATRLFGAAEGLFTFGGYDEDLLLEAPPLYPQGLLRPQKGRLRQVLERL